jgi:hypothetical protein
VAAPLTASSIFATSRILGALKGVFGRPKGAR